MRIDYITNKDYFKTIEKSVPKYFRKEAMLTDDQYNKLRDDQFALVVVKDNGDRDRCFPINNFSNTYVSSKYLEKFGSTLPINATITAAYYIKKAAETFGIELPGSISKMASLGMSGRVVSDFDTVESYTTQDNFLLPGAFKFGATSKKDVENYIANHDEYTALLSNEDASEFNLNLKKIASRYGIQFTPNNVAPLKPNSDELRLKLDLLPMQQKLAFIENQNIVCGRDAFVKEGVALRLVALDELDNQDDVGRAKAHIGRELLNKMASMYYNKEITAHKFASAVVGIDRMFGWDSEYQTSIPDPVKMVTKDAMDVDIMKEMDSKLTPAFAMYKSGSVDANGLQEMVSGIMTDVFSSFSGNLLRDYIMSHKDFSKLATFAPVDKILSEPTTTFESLDLNKKIAFIKELVTM